MLVNNFQKSVKEKQQQQKTPSDTLLDITFQQAIHVITYYCLITIYVFISDNWQFICQSPYSYL